MAFHVHDAGGLVRSACEAAGAFVKVRLLAALLLVIAAAMLAALSPLALKAIVDSLSGVPRGRTLPLASLMGAYVMSQWLAKAAGEARGLVYARAECRVSRTISERLFRHVMHLPLRFHCERQTGAVSQTLNNGLEGVQLIMQHLVLTVFPVLAELVTEVLVLGHWVSLPFLLLFCAAICCYAAAFWCSAGPLTRAARAAAGARVAAGAAMTDGLLNYEVVKYFTAEELAQERFRRELVVCEERWVAFYRRYSVNGVVVASIFAVFLAATILLASREVHAGRITIGDFVLVNTYMLQIAKPVELLGYAMQGLAQGRAMLEKMLELFAEAGEPRSSTVARPVSVLGWVVFDEVSVAYRSGQPVLDRVSFRIAAGGTLGIVGPSGSGKSTVVRLLMRLLEPDSGAILLDGISISAFAAPDLRRAVAVVPQDTLLLNETVRYNIAFGRPEATREEIERAARIARAHEFISALPDGYDTVVGERGVKLSGGERQRVAIARAVLRKPGIYVFDEATSSLDSRTETEILDNLQGISRSCTTLVIAHRLSSVVNADEIVVLEDGRVVERGTHGALLTRGGT